MKMASIRFSMWILVAAAFLPSCRDSGDIGTGETCGDGFCEAGETPSTCPADCAGVESSVNATIHGGGITGVHTDNDGKTVIASEELAVEYQIEVRDENGSPVGGMVVDYSEDDSGVSFIFISDPEKQYSSAIFVGTPSDLANLAGKADAIEQQEQPLLVMATIGLVVAIASITYAQVEFIESAYEIGVFHNTDVLDVNGDFREYCKTPEEIAGFWSEQAQASLSLGSIATSILLAGVGAEAFSIAIDSSEIAGMGPFALSKKLIEATEEGFNMQDVQDDTKLRVRFYDWQDKSKLGVVFAELHIIGIGCDSCSSDCSGQECGPDPVCGESCGTCSGGESCQSGQCVQGGPTCPADMNCSNLECGPDPVCGESCGQCPAGQTCEEAQCSPTVRFQDVGDGSILDADTNNLWRQTPEQISNKDQAISFCQGLGTGWRIPNLDELEDLCVQPDNGCGLHPAFSGPCGGDDIDILIPGKSYRAFYYQGVGDATSCFVYGVGYWDCKGINTCGSDWVRCVKSQ